ncbi:ankyrin repeat and MYND domain-containing protein 1 [Lampris incognitus]|uniref:ankyrin repeat and MYND domain-containing protein 1 n=1 Tax=Lampris incognitus TaxID=2546036 RepID=UPI0024B56433|nr:ankyrin repeat and MYND domain-containing protein 1 [Lampris incognitus]
MATCPGAQTAPAASLGGRREAGRRIGYAGPPAGGEAKCGTGAQRWPDGSRYEGAFGGGLKHGAGTFRWANGEYYEGSFYKDYRHGEGVYCWSTGHKFIGKFYLNRKEGYGMQLFSDGATFQGLYHADQRFGPGVLSYPDGRQDVGLWHGERLIKLCTFLEDGFCLNNFPEYAAYTGPTDTKHTQSQVDTDPLLSPYKDLLSDERFILPPDIGRYSTDSDHLPVPPGLRRELDKHFHGELWETGNSLNPGCNSAGVSTLQARMQAHIHTHRLEAARAGWDVASVLSLTRDRFGPKGPLELSSEWLIQRASLGDQQAVYQAVCTGMVHIDVEDARGNTALIAATMNCHNAVIHQLLDMGANIDKLNGEGMSALAVCHVLYYPPECLLTTVAETSPIKQLPNTQVLKSHSLSAQRSHSGPAVFATAIVDAENRFKTGGAALCNQMNQMHLADNSETCSWRTSRMSEEHAKQIPGYGCRESDDRNHDSLTHMCMDLPDGPETTTDTKYSEEEAREEKGGKGGEQESKETERGEREGGEDDQSRGKLRERVEDEENERTGEETAKEDRAGDERKAEREEKAMDEKLGREIEGEEEREKEKRDVETGEQEERAGAEERKTEEQSLFHNLATQEVMQHNAGAAQHMDTRGAIHKMAVVKTDVSVIRRCVAWNTLNLLLDRGADPNVSVIPMPVLFLAIKAAHTEAVRRLLQCGARTDIPLPPERKGLYPLHIAAGLPGPEGPRITELLLHAITDPDSQANDQDDIYELDKVCVDPASEYMSPLRQEPLEGGRTALHVACQRDNNYEHASEVVSLLLSHRASTHLLWSGHSPLSLAITRGNEQAVVELLKGGADPNLPLGSRVGNSLCALTNINYDSSGCPRNRTKMLDMLVKAGANILMPVMVGEGHRCTVGTAVDYAHHSFNQDLHIAHTPYHTLNLREREVFKERHLFLSKLVDLLRKPVFKFCYECGRSVSVVLTACSRCRKVFYCSKTCKLKAWNERHKNECIRMSARVAGIQQSVRSKSQRSRGPLSKVEKVFKRDHNLKENYSFN